MSNASRNKQVGRVWMLGYLGCLGFLGFVGFQFPAFFSFFGFFLFFGAFLKAVSRPSLGMGLWALATQGRIVGEWLTDW